MKLSFFFLQNQWFRIDMGEMYSVKFVGLQGHPSQRSYVKSFYVKYSPDGFRWSTFGYNPPVADYQVKFDGFVVPTKSLLQ